MDMFISNYALCLLCLLYYLIAFPKQKKVHNHLSLHGVRQLYRELKTLRTGDFLFIRKRKYSSMQDSILHNYLGGHVVVILKYNGALYGVDF